MMSDSLEVWLEQVVRITLRHSNIPAEMYQQGWKESYFEPMKAYYQGRD
jgi:hypothetical protein